MTAISAGALTAIGLVTVILGIVTWVKTGGKIGKALMAMAGGALLSTLLISPSLITRDIPVLLKKIFDMILSWF